MPRIAWEQALDAGRGAAAAAAAKQSEAAAYVREAQLAALCRLQQLVVQVRDQRRLSRTGGRLRSQMNVAEHASDMPCRSAGVALQPPIRFAIGGALRRRAATSACGYTTITFRTEIVNRACACGVSASERVQASADVAPSRRQMWAESRADVGRVAGRRGPSRRQVVAGTMSSLSTGADTGACISLCSVADHATAAETESCSERKLCHET